MLNIRLMQWGPATNHLGKTAPDITGKASPGQRLMGMGIWHGSMADLSMGGMETNYSATHIRHTMPFPSFFVF